MWAHVQSVAHAETALKNNILLQKPARVDWRCLPLTPSSAAAHTRYALLVVHPWDGTWTLETVYRGSHLRNKVSRENWALTALWRAANPPNLITSVFKKKTQNERTTKKNTYSILSFWSQHFAWSEVSVADKTKSNKSTSGFHFAGLFYIEAVQLLIRWARENLLSRKGTESIGHQRNEQCFKKNHAKNT